MNISIRKYQVNDFDKVIKLWNKCLQRDYISTDAFQKKILADSNFDPQGCLIAEVNEMVVGFMLGIIRKVPLENIGIQEDLGWITVFFVDPQYQRLGIGKRLLTEVIKYFQNNQRKKILVSCYVPNYFFPGVDIEQYEGGYVFLKSQGFEDSHQVVGMGNELQDMIRPAEARTKIAELKEQGIEIIDFQKKYDV